LIRNQARAILAAEAFVLLAVLLSWPLATHLSSTLPGPPGDNVAFVWNFWWMREVVSTLSSPFFTPYLFAPYGVDLTLNTTTPLPAFVGATALSPFGIVTAQNLVTIAALALNGFAAYLLARRFTSDEGAAFVGGLIFATCAFISSHLLGHFNLTSAFVLPLFMLQCLDAVQGSRPAAIRTGLVLAATAYIDYYYVIYELAIGLVLLAMAVGDWSIQRRTPGPIVRRLSWLVGALVLLVAGLIVVIWVTGGTDFGLLGSHVTMRTTYNPRQAFWVLLIVFVCLRTWPSIRMRRREDWRTEPSVRALLAAGAVFALAISPLIWRGVHLMLSGDYVSQKYFWRSAPSGVDISTLFFGNPLHPLWGPSVLGVYDRFKLSQTESLAWLGVVPMCLAGLAIWRERSLSSVRLWIVLASVFGLWALGPHLMAFGKDTGLILPQALLRYVPIVSNARMPARAMVMVNLAVAVLSAIALARIHGRARRPMLITAMVALAVLVDQIPAPFPLLALDHPPIYDVLRDRPEPGALCELPVGTVDGFGTMGQLDPRVQFYQTIHRRPIVGGMISRLPASIRTAYEQDPLLSALLRLSDPRPMDAEMRALPDRSRALEAFRANGIRFVMLDREKAPVALVDYVDRTLPLVLITRDGRRTLYRVP
jgi:hypothetical protein